MIFLDLRFSSCSKSTCENMYELSPPDKVFAFDAGKLRAPDITFWTAWSGELLLGCAALKELSPTEGEIKSMRTPRGQRRAGAGRALPNDMIKVGLFSLVSSPLP